MKKNVCSVLGRRVSVVLRFSANAQFGTEPSKLELIKLQDDLYVIHNAYVPGNVTALITNEGVILVDDKFEIDHDNLMAMLQDGHEPARQVRHQHALTTATTAAATRSSRPAARSRSRRSQARARMVGCESVRAQPDITVEPRGVDALGRQVGGDLLVRPRRTPTATSSCCSRSIARSRPATCSRPARGTPQLVDYTGGGSAKEWTATRRPRCSRSTSRPSFRATATSRTTGRHAASIAPRTQRMTELVTRMVRQNKSRADIEAVMRTEFGFQDFHVQRSLDGLVNEMR